MRVWGAGCRLRDWRMNRGRFERDALCGDQIALLRHRHVHRPFGVQGLRFYG